MYSQILERKVIHGATVINLHFVTDAHRVPDDSVALIKTIVTKKIKSCKPLLQKVSNHILVRAGLLNLKFEVLNINVAKVIGLQVF